MPATADDEVVMQRQPNRPGRVFDFAGHLNIGL